MNRGPIILSIDEAEYLLDQVPPPEPDEDPMITKLRQKLSMLLAELRKGAEGTSSN
ncbi:uncharacterized protein BJ171DRAFT_419404 [Polychytrium aggregatum]|uniref:uncharacterized protein n=1 Tax=Polychytrium aggregatum TaxID=110093 RepID=UPI0022FE117E|nr:uncharacterized protein BJ171DRAFT_419404 [Polychytrium aggregatum]KAI9208593.1 hypothetical protein BJ171DRAFT_419404 [Polychytrium aggregatum]